MTVYDAVFTSTLHGIGERARRARLARNFRQDELAARAGIGTATVRRFEKSGNASLENVLRIASALGADRAFEALFEAPRYASIDEAIEPPKQRQRARRRTT